MTMEKKQISAKPFMYPMPTMLIGANISGKPNFMTIAFCQMLCSSPPIFGLASMKTHYTNIGIKKNRTFSINIPSEEMVKATDYCGLVSGHKVDKSKVFDIFYGNLGTAPMIQECPINMECKLVQILEFGNNEIFIGEIVGSYAEERYLTDGLPDIKKISPIIFSMDTSYWKVGGFLGKAYSVGKGFEPDKQ